MISGGRAARALIFFALLSSSGAFACLALQSAINANDPKTISVALARAYRVWMDATPFTPAEFKALAASPLSLPDLEASRSEAQALLAHFRQIHGKLPHEEQNAWIAVAKKHVEEKISGIGQRDGDRETARKKVPDRVLPITWAAEANNFAQILPDGRLLYDEKIVDVTKTPKVILPIEAGSWVAIPSGKFAVAPSTGKWVDLTTGKITAQSPILPGSILPIWGAQNLEFHQGGPATFRAKESPAPGEPKIWVAYRYDFKVPGSRPELLSGVDSPYAFSGNGKHLLGMRRSADHKIKMKVVVYDVEKKSTRVVGEDVDFICSTAVAPDGKHFLAVIENRSTDQYDLWRIDSETATLVENRPLGTRFNLKFTLSPDGKYLLQLRRPDREPNEPDALIRSTETGAAIASARWQPPQPDVAVFDRNSKYVLLHARPGENRKSMFYDFQEWLRLGFASEDP